MKKFILVMVLVGLFMTANTVGATESNAVVLPTSTGYFWVRIKENLNYYLLSFSASSRAAKLDNFTELRMDELMGGQEANDEEAIATSLKRYEIQRNLSYGYAKKVNNEALLSKIRTRSLEQQRQMTLLQLKLQNQNLQLEMIRVQQETANSFQIAVETTNGAETGQTLRTQIRNIWYAPGLTDGSLTQEEQAPEDWTYSPGSCLVKYNRDADEYDLNLLAQTNSQKNPVSGSSQNSGNAQPSDTNMQGESSSGNGQNQVIEQGNGSSDNQSGNSGNRVID